MPINQEVLQDVLAGKKIHLDLRDMPDADMRDFSDTLEATGNTDVASAFRADWAKARRGEMLKGTVDLDASQLERTAPTLASKPGILKSIGSFLTGPLPVVGSTLQPPINRAISAVGNVTAKLAGVPSVAESHTPSFMERMATPPAHPETPSSPTESAVGETVAPPSNLRRIGAAAAGFVGEFPLALARDLTTPLGAGLQLAGLPVAQRALGTVAKIAGQALRPLGYGGAHLLEQLHIPLPVYEKATTAIAAVTRPQAVVDTVQAFNFSKSMEAHDAQEFFRGVVANTTPQERDVVMEQLQQVGQVRRAALTALREQVQAFSATGKLPPGSEAERLLLMGDTDAAVKIVKAADEDLRRFTETIPASVSRVISEAARKQSFALLPADKKAIGEEVMGMFNALRARIVSSGWKPREAFVMEEGAYVPDLYLGPELAAVGKEGGAATSRGAGTGIAAPEAERFRTRSITDLAEKRAKGLISSFDLPIYKGLMQESYAATYGEMLQSFASQPSLVTKDPRRGWSYLTGPRYGVLDKMFVHPAVKMEIDGMHKSMSLAEGFVDKYLSYFKYVVTVANPPVHVGNIVSNMFAMDGGGVSMVKDMGTMRAGMKSLFARDGTFKRIASTGLIDDAEFSTQHAKDIANVMRSALIENSTGEHVALDAVARILTEGPKRKGLSLALPGQIYQVEESTMKYLMAYVAYTKGIATHGVPAGDLLAAARHAEKWMVNYSNVPVAVRALRSGFPGALLTPFVTFQSKAVPLAIETFVRNPQKYVKWHAMFQGLNRASMAAAGVSDQDYQEYHRLRAENDNWEMIRPLVSLAPVLTLPVRGPHGEAYAVDLSRFTYFGQIFQPRGLPGMGMGPLVGGGLALFGKGPGGMQLFNPDAKDLPGLPPLSPPIWERQAQAFASAMGFIPPLAKRLAIGAASAMGPAFGPRGPKNTPASILELLGSTGARTTGGTRQTPVRQLLAAVAGNVEEVNLPLARRRAAMNKKREVGALTEQIATDALRRGRAR